MIQTTSGCRPNGKPVAGTQISLLARSRFHTPPCKVWVRNDSGSTQCTRKATSRLTTVQNRKERIAPKRRWIVESSSLRQVKIEHKFAPADGAMRLRGLQPPLPANTRLTSRNGNPIAAGQNWLTPPLPTVQEGTFTEVFPLQRVDACFIWRKSSAWRKKIRTFAIFSRSNSFPLRIKGRKSSSPPQNVLDACLGKEVGRGLQGGRPSVDS